MIWVLMIAGVAVDEFKSPALCAAVGEIVSAQLNALYGFSPVECVFMREA